MWPYVPDFDNLSRYQNGCDQAQLLRDFALNLLKIFRRLFLCHRQLLLSCLELEPKLLCDILTLVFTEERDVRVDVVNLVGKGVKSKVKDSVGVKTEETYQLVYILFHCVDIQHADIRLVKLYYQLGKTFVFLPQEVEFLLFVE